MPGLTTDEFPAKADTSDSWIKDPGALPAELRLTTATSCPAACCPCPARGDQAAVRHGARRTTSQAWKDFGTGEELPARLRRGHPGPPPAAVLGQLVADGKTGLRAVVVPADGPRPPCEAGAGDGRALGRRRRPTARQPGAARSGRSGSWPADPLAAGRRRALDRRAPSWSAAARAAPARRRPLLGGADAAGRAVGARRRPAAARAGPARPARPSTSRCPSHLSVSPLVTLRRDPAELARRLRRPLPRRAGAAGPARHRVPRLARGALRRRAAARPRRAARRRRRGRRPRRRAGRAAGARSWPASGPTGSRPRSRCRSRR